MNITPAATGSATYCPEDNKIRLYVGRVPRDEYLRLRSEGWTSTPKQGCDFVATWTPERYETAQAYSDGGLIDDEDQSPAERAADRAERFGGYCDKRTTEATGHADRFDAGPSAFGFQSKARAERAAARHDRLANYATDAWSKAEYWQHRTAGVIGHALHLCKPGVRMGRIKELEAELRKLEKSREEAAAKWRDWQKIAALTDPADQNKHAVYYAGYSSAWDNYTHPRAAARSDRYKDNETSLYTLLTCDVDPITGAEAAAMYFAQHADPDSPEWLDTRTSAWLNHLKLRLAYENQMLDAQGGRLEQCEVLAGGKLGGKLILKVNKSTATGRATSCDVIGPHVNGWTYRASNIPGTNFAAYTFDLERISPDAYTPPTAESLAELECIRAQIKAARPEKPACPLVNPTDADAERLQAIWNARGQERHCAAHLKEYGKDYAADFQPAEVCRITQAVYSANSKGSYARAETRGLKADAERCQRATNMYNTEAAAWDKRTGPAVCNIRIQPGGGKQFTPPRVIILTDKPQKPLPAAVWQPYAAKIECTEFAPLVNGGDYRGTVCGICGRKESEHATEPKSYAGKSHGLSYSVHA